ncbi:hypothetical protein CDD83_8566 [Cordyceps sp. RAO-2017]|nr:hypothetical protein CDD83_8566 [Cordyceps sp. RAO-2017]
MPGIVASFDATTNLVHLYYNTATLTLALQLRRVNPGADDVQQTWEPGSADQSGLIVNPSCLASASFAGVDLVLGITSQATKSGTTLTENDISIVSPVYKPLAATELTNKAVAACNTDQAAWVYYLQGTDADHLKISEANITDGTPYTYEGTTSIMPGSYLGAYCRGDTRYIIYQSNDDGLLHEYKCDDGGGKSASGP